MDLYYLISESSLFASEYCATICDDIIRYFVIANILLYKQICKFCSIKSLNYENVDHYFEVAVDNNKYHIKNEVAPAA